MSTFLREAAEARLQGIVDELRGLGMTVAIAEQRVIVGAPGEKILVMPTKLAPLIASREQPLEVVKPQTPLKTSPPTKAKRTPAGAPKPVCRFDGPEKCDRDAITKGFCGKHYQQFRKGKIDEDGGPKE